MLSDPGLVQVPFAFGADNSEMTTFETAVLEEHQPADSAAAERLWDALYLARAGGTMHPMADLEDAVFRFYLPMARTIAHTVTGDDAADRVSVEQAAELGLAHAVLAWRQRTSGGFRRFARSTILRQLQSH